MHENLADKALRSGFSTTLLIFLFGLSVFLVAFYGFAFSSTLAMMLAGNISGIIYLSLAWVYSQGKPQKPQAASIKRNLFIRHARSILALSVCLLIMSSTLIILLQAKLVTGIFWSTIGLLLPSISLALGVLSWPIKKQWIWSISKEQKWAFHTRFKHFIEKLPFFNHQSNKKNFTIGFACGLAAAIYDMTYIDHINFIAALIKLYKTMPASMLVMSLLIPLLSLCVGLAEEGLFRYLLFDF
jgi:hypothetical protein